MIRKTVSVKQINTVSERFFEERERLGLTQADIAKICEVRKATVSAWENGAKIPPEALATLMREKGLDVFYVLIGPGVDGPQPMMLDPAERDLMLSYRAAPEERRRNVRMILLATEEAAERQGAGTYVRARQAPMVHEEAGKYEPSGKKPGRKASKNNQGG